MAAVLTKSESSTDSKGKTVTTETWEDFAGPLWFVTWAAQVPRITRQTNTASRAA